ncbi:hypothetical protein EW146_g5843 [Bondarzewia mesenterica]|uniref:Uncharacterized protein n=1 Tax=Bondarzewia mesenterica TaxID=1095465 RepID=A0A4S4LQA9_9AGAM|nr:hypothetical protein EW146_g5843 [Bondarzewia mesenterica]
MRDSFVRSHTVASTIRARSASVPLLCPPPQSQHASPETRFPSVPRFASSLRELLRFGSSDVRIAEGGFVFTSGPLEAIIRSAESSCLLLLLARSVSEFDGYDVEDAGIVSEMGMIFTFEC